MRRADQVGALLLLGFAGIVIYQAAKLPYKAEYGPGPGFIPTWLGIILALCSVALFVGAIKPAPADKPVLSDRSGLVRLLIVGMATALLALLTPYVGMLVAIGLFMGAVVWLMSSRRSWATIIGLAVLTPVGVWLLFGRWLGVPLPKGIFGI